MARPKRATTMARCAASAVLAAVEIYNKPTVEYREQTFAILMISAWEILLKARLVQQAGGKMQSIYARKKDKPREFVRTDEGEPITIGLRRVLGRVDTDKNVDDNIRGLLAVRNRAAHLGVLVPDTRQSVLEFGTASVQNFFKLSLKWFGESIDPPYLLPVGFLGTAKVAQVSTTKSQRDLLKDLNTLAQRSGSAPSDYDVVMHVKVELNRGVSGGGNIGTTSDPNAPRVRMSDDEVLRRFPWTHGELVTNCRRRYDGFKTNQVFNDAMKGIKERPECAYERRRHPTKGRGVGMMLYNPTATLARLDRLYARRPDTQQV